MVGLNTYVEICSESGWSGINATVADDRNEEAQETSRTRPLAWSEQN